MSVEDTEKKIDAEHVITCARELLAQMDIEATVEEGVVGDTPTFVIRSAEAGLLIGEDGQNLLALNYLIKKIIEHKGGGPIEHFMIDVNDYQRRRFDDLRDRARMGAQRVRYFKKEVVLQPMTAFERRIIHLALQEYPDITTESIGDGRERRVVIKPYP